MVKRRHSSLDCYPGCAEEAAIILIDGSGNALRFGIFRKEVRFALTLPPQGYPICCGNHRAGNRPPNTSRVIGLPCAKHRMQYRAFDEDAVRRRRTPKRLRGRFGFDFAGIGADLDTECRVEDEMLLSQPSAIVDDVKTLLASHLIGDIPWPKRSLKF